MDIATLLLANIVLGFTLALCVLVVAIRRNKQLYLWAIAFCVYALSITLLGLRGQIPDLLSIILANVLIASMLAMFTEGIYRLGQRRPPRLLIWWPTLAMAISLAFYLDDFVMRVIIMTVISVYQAGYLVWSVARDFQEERGQGKWIFIIAVIILTAMLMLRAVVTIMGDNSLVGITSYSPVQAATFVGALVSITMIAIGLLVIYLERSEQICLTMALHDPLTQLGNRRVLDKALNELASGTRKWEVYGLVMIDLDHFKPLNDTYGHAIGDQLLIEVAYRIKESVKAQDTVVRLGGDEFIVLVTGLGDDLVQARAHARTVANRILQQVTEPYHLLMPLENRPLSTLTYESTCSIGVSLFRGHAMSIDIVMARADVAMYKAKQQGRNRVVFAGTEAGD